MPVLAPPQRSFAESVPADGVKPRSRPQNRPLAIGLVNNMPDAALKSTERQFTVLLHAAAGPLSVELRLFSLSELPRSAAARDHMRDLYCPIDELGASRLDALIVTGTEPRTARLSDEPYWQALTRVLDWAEENTSSSIWSCLAAHAAVLHLDGIDRYLLDHKRFGIFEFRRASAHPLLAGVPGRIRIVHSRWNDLDARALAACNYRILTHSEAGVDTFVKHRKSLLVFFQGHPEYDERALLREYRRDIGRFLRAERQNYPGLPEGYFYPAAKDTLVSFQNRAVLDRRENLLDEFPAAWLESKLIPLPRAPVVRLYRNWLSYLYTCKRLDQALAADEQGLSAAAPQVAEGL